MKKKHSRIIEQRCANNFLFTLVQDLFWIFCCWAVWKFCSNLEMILYFSNIRLLDQACLDNLNNFFSYRLYWVFSKNNNFKAYCVVASVAADVLKTGQLYSIYRHYVNYLLFYVYFFTLFNWIIWLKYPWQGWEKYLFYVVNKVEIVGLVCQTIHYDFRTILI